MLAAMRAPALNARAVSPRFVGAKPRAVKPPARGFTRPGDNRRRFAQIVAAAGLQEFDAAEEFLQELPEGASDDLRVIYLQGIIAEGHGNLTLATSHYRSVIQQWPDHTDSLQKLAKLHFQLGEMSRAIEYLEQLSALHPGNAT